MTAAVRCVQIITLVVLLASIAPLTATAESGQDTAPQPMIGDQAPPFELESVAGGTMSLDGLRGRFVVIHFGASW